MLHYFVKPHLLSHQWEVSLTFEQQAEQSYALKLANWTPGSYMIRDFSRHIVRIQAFCDGKEVELTQTAKNIWQTPAIKGHFQIQYWVYANDMSVRGSYLDTQRGFFDGACLFLSIADLHMQTHCVSFENLPENWQISTMLPYDKKKQCFQAASYAELIDCPVEMGAKIEFLDFQARGIPHRIALSGYYADFDRRRLIEDCRRICESILDLFPAPAPFQEYLFLLHLGDQIYGGLEHLNSTALHIDRSSLPKWGLSEPDENYTRLLGLISHEYFHAWNVKSIKPATFIPYQLDNETYTEQLWAFEGITSYYDDLMLVRSGVISPQHYLQLLADLLTHTHRQAGRTVQTLAQSSFAAWHKYYKQDENSRNSIVSYYQQGALAALCLDLFIRQNSPYSLDTVMQQLYLDWQTTHQGLKEGQWQQRASEIVGLDLNSFLQPILYSTSPLPLQKYLNSIGIHLEWRTGSSEQTGQVVDSIPDSIPQADLGCRYQQNASDAVLTQVLNQGSCEQAGLMPKDKIIAIDGFACYNFAAQTNTIGQNYSIHFFRHGVLLQTQLTPQASSALTAYLRIDNQTATLNWLQIS